MRSRGTESYIDFKVETSRRKGERTRRDRGEWAARRNKLVDPRLTRQIEVVVSEAAKLKPSTRLNDRSGFAVEKDGGLGEIPTPKLGTGNDESTTGGVPDEDAGVTGPDEDVTASTVVYRDTGSEVE